MHPNQAIVLPVSLLLRSICAASSRVSLTANNWLFAIPPIAKIGTAMCLEAVQKQHSRYCPSLHLILLSVLFFLAVWLLWFHSIILYYCSWEQNVAPCVHWWNNDFRIQLFSSAGTPTVTHIPVLQELLWCKCVFLWTPCSHTLGPELHQNPLCGYICPRSCWCLSCNEDFSSALLSRELRWLCVLHA